MTTAGVGIRGERRVSPAGAEVLTFADDELLQKTELLG